MKLLSFSLTLFLSACGDKSPSETVLEDTGNDGVIPGCGIVDKLCYSYWGENHRGQEEANCTASSEAQVTAGNSPFVFFPDGCPEGAVSECTGLFGLDAEGQPVPTAQYSIFYYSGLEDSTQSQEQCIQNGGTFTDLQQQG